MKTIETPYGKKTPELLCKAMDAYEREPALTAALDQAVEALAASANMFAVEPEDAADFGDNASRIMTAWVMARAALDAAKKARG